MRINNTAAALVLVLSCASCVQPSESSGSGGAPALGAADENGFGTEVWSGPEDELGGPAYIADPASYAEPEGLFTYHVCVLVAVAGPVVKAAFCRSQPAPDVRARCFSHVSDSVVAWRNWCYEEFHE